MTPIKWSKFNNIYKWKNLLINGRKRTIETILTGNVGKGLTLSLKGFSCEATITKVDPINAVQAAMEGHEVTAVEDGVDHCFVTNSSGKYGVVMNTDIKRHTLMVSVDTSDRTLLQHIVPYPEDSMGEHLRYNDILETCELSPAFHDQAH